MSVLPYSSPDIARPARRWSLLVGAVAVIVLFLVIPITFTNSSSIYIDPVTGSLKRSWTYRLGTKTATQIDQSPLVRRMSILGIPWTPTWQFLHRYDRGFFGGNRGVSCGMAPPIYSFRAIATDYCEAATDTEIRAFVAIMQTGTEEQQRAAIDAASDKVFGSSPAILSTTRTP